MQQGKDHLHTATLAVRGLLKLRAEAQLQHKLKERKLISAKEAGVLQQAARIRKYNERTLPGRPRHVVGTWSRYLDAEELYVRKCLKISMQVVQGLVRGSSCGPTIASCARREHGVRGDGSMFSRDRLTISSPEACMVDWPSWVTLRANLRRAGKGAPLNLCDLQTCQGWASVTTQQSGCHFC